MEDDVKKNERAFPRPSSELNGNACEPSQSGMTLRDYFAAKAMQGLLTSDWEFGDTAQEYAYGVSRKSYQIADAMLTERDKP